MAGSAEEAKNESDVTPPDSKEGKLGFDNDTLRGEKNKTFAMLIESEKIFKPLLTRGKCFFL